MATSTFRGIIEFFDKIGIYDVVLPFLLVFTVVFAILEKTKIFGTEEIGGTKYTKKNLNAMASFVVAFLVVASTKLVKIINQALGNVVVFLIVILSFLLLIGSFFSEGEEVILKGAWRTVFMSATLVGIILIFLAAIPMESGNSWLEWFWNWMSDHWQNDWVSAIIFIIVIIVFIALITRGGGGKKKEEKKD
ncbi:hypothetical protein HYU07_02685 [Candidatus Woesearchaeota archaeon]|nr:hypothetical protein [Candidatus Woesearchaeota archaeon]